jgi:diguanylate cyclase (GGDEF)-like protein
MNQRAKILVVDDEAMNIEILNAALDGDYDISFATNGADAIAIAVATQPDLILLDVMMPQMDGYEVCRRLTLDPLTADIPIIFATGLGDQAAEVRGLSLGAIDYVTKPISPVIVRARIRNHLELKRLRDNLAELAVTDALTGLGNRRWLETSLKVETARLTRSGDWLSVIMLDIDCFKLFNDTYGHPAGDRCITKVAAAISRAMRRATDLTARYGGEEFACVLPGADLPDAMAVAQHIRSDVAALNIEHRNSLGADHVTVSIGVATARCQPGALAELWVEAADQQLYRVKTSGRDDVSGVLFEMIDGTIAPPRLLPTCPPIRLGGQAYLKTPYGPEHFPC